MEFSDLYKTYKPEIYRYLRRCTRYCERKEVIEELVNNTFVKAYFAREQYNPIYTYRTWLYRIAKNTLIDYNRKGRIDTMPLDNYDCLSDALAIDDQLFLTQRATYLYNKVCQLDENSKDIAVKFFYEGYTQMEIAELYGLKEYNVIYMCKKMKDKLRELIKNKVYLQ